MDFFIEMNKSTVLLPPQWPALFVVIVFCNLLIFKCVAKPKGHKNTLTLNNLTWQFFSPPWSYCVSYGRLGRQRHAHYVTFFLTKSHGLIETIETILAFLSKGNKRVWNIYICIREGCYSQNLLPNYILPWSKKIVTQIPNVPDEFISSNWARSVYETAQGKHIQSCRTQSIATKIIVCYSFSQKSPGMSIISQCFKNITVIPGPPDRPKTYGQMLFTDYSTLFIPVTDL